MDEQMKTTLAEYMKKMLAAVETGANFAADQIPLIVQEKLAFDFWWSAVWVVLAVAGVIFGIWLIRGGNKLYKIDKYNDMVVGYFFGGFSLLAAGSIIGLINTYYALKISLAPRLYIIDWLLGMNGRG
jgi:hypothetical protein